MHSFADPGKTTAGAPSVPKEILNDFYRVTNDSEKIIDDVIADMKAAQAPPAQAAPQAAPVRQPGQPTATTQPLMRT
jgi:hypothetical protein